VTAPSANGAGKTTLLQLAVGLTRPTSGEVSVLGLSPRDESSALLPRLGFVAQEHPLYRGLTVAETLKLGRKLNPSWDQTLAGDRVDQLGLPLGQKAGKLSGGQQAQLALTLALAKRPDCSCWTAGRLTRSAGPSRVPAVGHGGGRRIGHDRDPVFAHRRRPRAGVRSPCDLDSGGPARRADREHRREPSRADRCARTPPPSLASIR
jgi:hypothetical protein